MRNLDQDGAKNPYWKGGASRVLHSCARCGKEFFAARANKRKYCSPECAYKTFAIGRKPRKRNPLADRHRPKSAEHRRKIGDSCRGERNYNWKGGEKMQNGYKFVSRPGYGSSRYCPEHRIIAEKALGRELKSGEIVHHINGDKSDNRNCNLLICTRGYHEQLHRKMSYLYQREHFA